MSTSLVLETTEAFQPLTVQRFVDNVTKLGILHAHAQEIYHLPEHPHIIKTIDTTKSLPPPPNTHGHRTL